MTGSGSALHVTGLRRSFGATCALDGCDVTVASGEIRALLGENGSGKSTLVKILSGVLRADGGDCRLFGRPLAPSSPRAAQALGVATVFQETLVAPELSVLDNIFLGADRGSDRSERAARARDILAELRAEDIDPFSSLDELSLERRQLVTIARALARRWTLLILDEATSALDVNSRNALFDHLRRQPLEGRAVLFITHRMDEIATLADAVTLLQAGRTTATLPIGTTSTAELVKRISRSRGGAQRGTAGRPPQTPPADGGEVRIRTKRLRLRPGGGPIEFSARDGEIVGIGGLDGHGQSDFLARLAGFGGPGAGGTVEARRANAGWHAIVTPHDAARAGIRYVPRERKAQGLFGRLPILDNFAAPTLGAHSTGGIVSVGGLKRSARHHLDRMRTRYPGLGAPITSLSGGNQQKVLLARWLATEPQALLLNDPSRGVDAATKVDIHETFRGLAARGVTLLLLSSELEELVAVCDRVIVFREGAISADLEAAGLSRQRIVAAMFGRVADGEAERA